MKADLHIHSLYSPDSISKPESIFAAAVDRGIGVIAITDHVTPDSWRHFADIQHRYPVDVVFGQEIKVYQENRMVGQVLGLFLTQPIKSTSMQDILAEIRAQNGIISIAHPFCERRQEFIAYSEIDDWSDIAIEVKNGRTFTVRDNEMAAGLAQRLNTRITAGSDAHTPFEVGNVYTEFDGKNANDLKKAIIAKDVTAGGHPSSALFTVVSNAARLGITI